MKGLPGAKARRARREARRFRDQVRDLLDQGLSYSAIARELGKSYGHTAAICRQVLADQVEEEAARASRRIR